MSKNLEKEPPIFDRVVGYKATPEEIKKGIEALKEMSREFYEKWKEKSIPLTEKQTKIVSLVDQKIVRNLKYYGLEKRAGWPIRFLCLKPEDYTKATGKKGAGLFYSIWGVLAIKYPPEYYQEDNQNIAFAMLIAHEYLHARSYRAAQIFKDKAGIHTWMYRSGLSIEKLGEQHDRAYFDLFDEMMISLGGRMLAEDLINKHRDLFKKEEVERRVEETKSKENYHSVQLELLEGAYGYREKEFHQLRDLVAGKLKIEKQKVFLILLDALLTGRLLKLGKLFDKAFGPGSFRILANMTKENCSKVLNYFETSDSDKKESLAKEILSDEEWEMYQKHKEMRDRFRKERLPPEKT